MEKNNLQEIIKNLLNEFPLFKSLGEWNLHSKGLGTLIYKNKKNNYFLKIDGLNYNNEENALSFLTEKGLEDFVPKLIYSGYFSNNKVSFNWIISENAGNSLPFMSKEEWIVFLKNANFVFEKIDFSTRKDFVFLKEKDKKNQFKNWKEIVFLSLEKNNREQFLKEVEKYEWDKEPVVLWNGDTHPGQFVMTEEGGYKMLDWGEAMWSPYWMPIVALNDCGNRYGVSEFKNEEFSTDKFRLLYWIKFAYFERWLNLEDSNVWKKQEDNVKILKRKLEIMKKMNID